MKSFIIIALLLCSAVCWGEEITIIVDKVIATDGKIYQLTPYQAKGQYISLPADREVKILDTLDKIYSMVADLEIKFMGIERYNQIYDPDNEGEVAKQKRFTEEAIAKMEQ